MSNEEKTHENVLQDIKGLSNSERIKLLEKLYYEYFDNRPPEEIIRREEIREAWGEDYWNKVREVKFGLLN